jgi:hypothetical protein
MSAFLHQIGDDILAPWRQRARRDRGDVQRCAT